MAVDRLSSRKALANLREAPTPRTKAQASSITRSRSGQFQCREATQRWQVPRKSVSCNQHTFRKNRCCSSRSKGCTSICRRQRRCNDPICSMPRTCAGLSRPAQQAMHCHTAIREAWSWSVGTHKQLCSIKAPSRWTSKCSIRKRTRWVEEMVTRATKWHTPNWTELKMSHQSLAVSRMTTCSVVVVKAVPGRCSSWANTSSQGQRFHR